jgi:hypothetical protein
MEEYIKSYEEEFAMVKEGKGVEALNHYNSIGHLAVFKLIEKVTNETAFNTEGAEGSTKQGSNLTSITNWTIAVATTITRMTRTITMTKWQCCFCCCCRCCCTCCYCNCCCCR